MNPALVVNRATEISSIQAPAMTQAMTQDMIQDMIQVLTSEATVGIVVEIGDQYGGIN